MRKFIGVREKMKQQRALRLRRISDAVGILRYVINRAYCPPMNMRMLAAAPRKLKYLEGLAKAREF